MGISADSIEINGGESIINEPSRHIAIGNGATPIISINVPEAIIGDGEQVEVIVGETRDAHSPALMVVGTETENPRPTRVSVINRNKPDIAVLIIKGAKEVALPYCSMPAPLIVCSPSTTNLSTIDQGFFIGANLYTSVSHNAIILSTEYNAQKLTAPTANTQALRLAGNFKLDDTCNIQDKNGNYIVRNGVRVDS